MPRPLMYIDCIVRVGEGAFVDVMRRVRGLAPPWGRRDSVGESSWACH